MCIAFGDIFFFPPCKWLSVVSPGKKSSLYTDTRMAGEKQSNLICENGFGLSLLGAYHPVANVDAVHFCYCSNIFGKTM